jgi:Flp pilus assembly protein TadB
VSLKEIAFGALGALAGDMFYRRAVKRDEHREVQNLERSLPLVMERVVMAAGAGLDILPAIAEAAGESEDPVSRS